mgnify:FL=1
MISIRSIYGWMTLAAFCWAGAFIAGKLSVPYIPPLSLTFLRFLVATVVLFAVKSRAEQKLGTGMTEYRVSKKDWPVLLFTGVVGMVFYHGFFFSALQYTTAINASIIAAMNPIITVVLGFFFVKERISGRALLGILISFAGVILTITSFDVSLLASMEVNPGDLLMLLAVISWAAYSVFSKAKASHIPPLALTYYSFLVCTLVSLPLAMLEKPWEWAEAVPWTAMAAVVYMSIFASVIGYLIQQISIRRIGPSRTSVFINLVPVFSILLSVLILSEELEPVKLITAAMIITGVFICQTERKQP